VFVPNISFLVLYEQEKELQMKTKDLDEQLPGSEIARSVEKINNKSDVCLLATADCREVVL
jgi:hypothetical protein